MGNWLEALRDRVIVRSQMGKQKLDAVVTRRRLDGKLCELGGQVLALIREGRLVLPEEVATLVGETRELEERLRAQQAQIAALASEGT